MKKIILALLFVPLMAFAQPTPQQQAAAEHKDNFCKDMAGTALVMSQFRDQGVTMIRAVSELQNYLNEHPDFPATPKEKEYAIEVIKTLYKFPSLKGDTLAEYIYAQCLNQEADL